MKVMKKMMNKKTETKYVSQIGSGTWVQIPCLIDGAQNTARNALPAIAEGSDGSDRIGNEIVPVRSDVKLIMRLRPVKNAEGNFVYPGARDLTCVVYYGYSRKVKTLDNIADINTDLQRLLDNGQDGAVPFGGDPEAAILPVRNEIFDLKVKKFRLHKGTGSYNLQNDGSEGTAVGDGGRMIATTTLKFKPPAKLKYDTTNYPSNYAPFFVVGYYHNGEPSPVFGQATEGEVEIWWNREVYFKDF